MCGCARSLEERIIIVSAPYIVQTRNCMWGGLQQLPSLLTATYCPEGAINPCV
jgi:hypothetical protein